MDFVDANGIRFAYLSEGSGPLVLLLHGFPDTPYTWERVMPEVARAGYRAVAPFMRGYHPTSIPKDGKYDGDTLGRDVLALIEALGEQQAIVVGHDWGALAAYTAAAVGPERVRALITVGVPHPRSVLPTPRVLWTVRHFFVLRNKGAAHKIRAKNHAYIDQLVRRWSPAWKDMPADETARVKQAFAEPGCLEAACSYYAALTPFMPASLRASIKVPSVAFAGIHDNMSPRVYEKARRCFVGSYEVVQVPGGHFMHREHPNEFTAELTRVLRAAG
ncbi:MAG TPA: alpha/beta hydrolase [Kofleriaceae bacterium]|nr:alpha/beta hydrolase [Kofleriaceae bacterium]